MKKILALLLTFAMLFSLAGCGGGDDDKPPASNDDKTSSSSQQQTSSNHSDENKPVESEQSGDNKPFDEGKTIVEKADAIAASFGIYNGSPIAWRVLDIDTENERALLITMDCLAEMMFHAERTEDLTYRTSDLRVWLIGNFHFSSFTAEEKERIIEVDNPQDTNSETGAREPEGYETTDTVFILSVSEMQQYFADDADMVGLLNGEPTSYWTRTPGNDTTGYVCTYGDENGGLYMTGNAVESTGVAVRPAIWVDLSGEWTAAAAPQSESGETSEPLIVDEMVGTPEGWPENEYTKLVPEPNCGGKVTNSNEIGKLFAIELEWTMEQGMTYAQQLEDSGFGDDCVEKFEQQGYIDRTANGVNVQLLELGGKVTVSIMPAPDSQQGGETTDSGTFGSAEILNELFDIEQLAGISEFPDYAKKAIGDLRWCDDLGADNQFNYVYNAYMKEVTQEDFETYIANLTANAPTSSEEGNIFAFYWDWGQITGEYFPDSGTLDTILAAK